MAEAMGFYTDTTVCIGCKACEVACKERNQLPAENGGVRELRGCPETSRHHYASIKQPPCGNEKQADYMERACSA